VASSAYPFHLECTASLRTFSYGKHNIAIIAQVFIVSAVLC